MKGEKLKQELFSLLAEKGAKLMGAGDLSGLAQLCQDYPGQIRTYDVDLTDEAATELFIRDVAANYPLPTHIVHLPALRVINTKFKNFDEERFDKDLSVQVRSAVKICKTFVPKMAKAKEFYVKEVEQIKADAEKRKEGLHSSIKDPQQLKSELDIAAYELKSALFDSKSRYKRELDKARAAMNQAYVDHIQKNRELRNGKSAFGEDMKMKWKKLQ